MLDILGSIWWLAVALGLLVTFHEFGHFWVARRAGVRVLKFSVGFGAPLWERRAASGTRYAVGAIPLGGYVKMLDEREGPVEPAERDQAFNRKSLGARAAIVAAGPIFNLVFAVAAFWLMFMIGIPESRPVVGPTEGMAAEAGIREDDMIRSIDGAGVGTWTHAVLALIPRALDREAVSMTLERPDGEVREVTLPLDRLGPEFREEDALEHLGLVPWRPEFKPVIGTVTQGAPADRAGLQAGDLVTAVAGREVSNWTDLAEEIPAAAEEADGEIAVTFVRDGIERSVMLAPERRDGRLVIGVAPPEPDEATRTAFERSFTILRYGPLEGLGQAFSETWRLTAGTLGILGRMVTGSASLSNLSGPITIARMAQSSARLGLSRFLFFLGLISLSLAIINLLPIPVLDGGHLLYFAIEAVKGSPVSERAQLAGQYIGLLMIVGIMSLAVFNDILRLVQ